MFLVAIDYAEMESICASIREPLAPGKLNMQISHTTHGKPADNIDEGVSLMYTGTQADLIFSTTAPLNIIMEINYKICLCERILSFL